MKNILNKYFKSLERTFGFFIDIVMQITNIMIFFSIEVPFLRNGTRVKNKLFEISEEIIGASGTKIKNSIGDLVALYFYWVTAMVLFLSFFFYFKAIIQVDIIYIIVNFISFSFFSGIYLAIKDIFYDKLKENNWFVVTIIISETFFKELFSSEDYKKHTKTFR